MHILDAFIVTDNYDSEGFHNIIVNLFDVILKFATMLPPHALSQLEPNILLVVDALVQSNVVITFVVKPIFLSLSPKLLRG